MTFYEVLKAVCRKKNTTPCAVAEAIGISKSNATNWKAGKSPKLDTVIRIANHLGVSTASLVKGVEASEMKEQNNEV